MIPWMCIKKMALTCQLNFQGIFSEKPKLSVLLEIFLMSPSSISFQLATHLL